MLARDCAPFHFHRTCFVHVGLLGLCFVFGCLQMLGQANAGTVAMENVGLLLEGAIVVELPEVNLSDSPKTLKKKLERVVGDVWSLAGLQVPSDFQGFSDEVEALLGDIDELDLRDAQRLGGRLEGLSTEDRLYWLIQSRLEEVKLQVAVEMGFFANARLREDLFNQSETDGVPWTEDELAERIAEWSQFDPNAPLPAIPFPDWSGQNPTDHSALPGRSVSTETGMESNQALLERIVFLLETHDARIRALEMEGVRNADGAGRGTNRFSDFQGSKGLRPPSEVPALASIGLPDAFDIRFGPGSASLGLNAQMQLSEVMELMGRYPELRVVCTGHTDSEGDRISNVQLSKRRAQVTRSYLLQSGVQPERVLMNFFGEDRSMGAGAADRRVEVAFFAN